MNWPTAELGDLCEFLDGQRRPVKESERKAGSYPYYGANGQQGTIDGYIFDEPLVLLAEDGGHFSEPHRGIAYSIEGRTWVNNHAHVLRPRTNVDLRYLTRVLENHDVSRYVTGTTRAKLTKAGASRIEIPLPPLPEQRRIAAILDHADTLRAKRDLALRRIQDLKTAIFFNFFGDPGSTKRWVRMPLAEACQAIIDCPHSTPKWTEAGEICLRTPNLGKGRWVWNETRFVSKEDFEERSKRGQLQHGDIVLSREGTVGIAALVPSEVRMCMGQRLVQVRPNPEIALGPYLLDLLLYELDPRRIARVMVGSTATHLNVKELRSLSIPVPPIDIQQAFLEARSGVERMQDANEHSVNHLDEVFRSLQSRAFGVDL